MLLRPPIITGVRAVVQERVASKKSNIVVRRRWCDNGYKQGYVDLEVGG